MAPTGNSHRVEPQAAGDSRRRGATEPDNSVPVPGAWDAGPRRGPACPGPATVALTGPATAVVRVRGLPRRTGKRRGARRSLLFVALIGLPEHLSPDPVQRVGEDTAEAADSVFAERPGLPGDPAQFTPERPG